MAQQISRRPFGVAQRTRPSTGWFLLALAVFAVWVLAATPQANGGAGDLASPQASGPYHGEGKWRGY